MNRNPDSTLDYPQVTATLSLPQPFVLSYNFTTMMHTQQLFSSNFW